MGRWSTAFPDSFMYAEARLRRCRSMDLDVVNTGDALLHIRSPAAPCDSLRLEPSLFRADGAVSLCGSLVCRFRPDPSCGDSPHCPSPFAPFVFARMRKLQCIVFGRLSVIWIVGIPSCRFPAIGTRARGRWPRGRRTGRLSLGVGWSAGSCRGCAGWVCVSVSVCFGVSVGLCLKGRGG